MPFCERMHCFQVQYWLLQELAEQLSEDFKTVSECYECARTYVLNTWLQYIVMYVAMYIRTCVDITVCTMCACLYIHLYFHV